MLQRVWDMRKLPSASINDQECWALWLTLESSGLRNTVVHYVGDNQAMLYGLHSGHSPSWHMNYVIERVSKWTCEHNVVLDLHYVRSANNPTDGMSRGWSWTDHDADMSRVIDNRVRREW